MDLGAIILTGGASARMGHDKALQLWGGLNAAVRLAALARRLGADPVVAAGRPAADLLFVADETPGGGPVGGILAGARPLRAAGCSRALVLAVDAPTLALADLQPLLAAASPGAAFDGLPVPMAVDLDCLPEDALASWPLRRLVERAGLASLPAPVGALARLRGANTPDERIALLNDAGLAKDP